MANFDFLEQIPQFSDFSYDAVAAEKLFFTSYADCLKQCRLDLELAIRWLYKHESHLDKTLLGKASLKELIDSVQFRTLVEASVWTDIEFIQRYGNLAVHKSRKNYDSKKVETFGALAALFRVMDFLATRYVPDYVAQTFDDSFLNVSQQEKDSMEVAIGNLCDEIENNNEATQPVDAVDLSEVLKYIEQICQKEKGSNGKSLSKADLTKAWLQYHQFLEQTTLTSEEKISFGENIERAVAGICIFLLVLDLFLRVIAIIDNINKNF